MINLIVFLLSVNSCYFLKLSPGVMSQGLGGVSIMIDEGLSAFHNPANIQGTKFNVTLSKWLYSTNFFTLGASYKDNVLGISYINYGGIQGYNDFGTATHEFTPFDFSLSLGRKFGSLGLLIKTFGEKIDDQTLWGVGCGMSSFLDLGNVAVGAKIDNLGKEFLQDAKIPLLTAFGLKFTLPKNTTIFIEFKAPDWEINAGFLYCYQYITLLSGTKYIMPKDLITNNTITGSFSELDFCGGIVIQVENYKIGYSFVYTKFSNAHQFSITFTPERSRRGEG